ncbi:lytic transglycosylase domain-containing protein [Salmonella enterica]|nr:lytic transglycosylase domain-containing protein [Salmonella enterica subsp. enterica serovar Sandiego]EEC0251373.1 lytic transglycosylase domain-containing protein [Salmonella enterica subsp. enterica]EJW2128685.1 lytic transglycosylase domain-containing protein [Salmonella enterica]EEE4266741.1 transglycosylase SLT domain-containing protein [Salmonella enterica subsp. enterica serovar Sandiego]EKT1704577.1 lytic transglycosylase domain-containing protein [Salmonella enterica]
MRSKLWCLLFCLQSGLLSAEPLRWIRIPTDGTVSDFSKDEPKDWIAGEDAARYQELIAEVASQHLIDPLLVQAVVAVESTYHHDIVSKKGAIGLMQLMPATAARYGKYNLTVPRENLEAGVTYLGELLQRFGRLDLALASYNAGEGAIARYGGRIPPYPETQRYVKKVLDCYQRLKQSAANELPVLHPLALGDMGQLWSLLTVGSSNAANR